MKYIVHSWHLLQYFAESVYHGNEKTETLESVELEVKYQIHILETGNIIPLVLSFFITQ